MARKHGRYTLACAGRNHGPAGLSAAGGGPPAIANLGALSPSLWLRGDLGVTTGATFTWADQGSSGATFNQSTGLKQPAVNPIGIGGKQTLTFNSLNATELDTATLLSAFIGASSTAWTMLVVAKYTGATATQANSWTNAQVFEDTGANWGSLASTTVVLAYNFNGADKSVRPALAAPAPYCAISSLSGGVLSCAVNGGAAVTLAGVGPAGGTTLAARIGGGGASSVFWDGEIGEIALWPRVLTPTFEQVQAVNAARLYWGI